MLNRILPHPQLTVLLTIVWLLLVNHFSLGNLILGLGLGLAIPALTRPYWENRPTLRHPLRVAAYVLLVIWDILVANVAVARIILFSPRDRIRSAWVTVPLDLRSPEAITVLAGTITMTPGTVSACLSADARAILVHCLDTGDPAAECAAIKTRYERRLKEIFE